MVFKLSNTVPHTFSRCLVVKILSVTFWVQNLIFDWKWNYVNKTCCARVKHDLKRIFMNRMGTSDTGSESWKYLFFNGKFFDSLRTHPKEFRVVTSQYSSPSLYSRFTYEICYIATFELFSKFERKINFVCNYIFSLNLYQVKSFRKWCHDACWVLSCFKEVRGSFRQSYGRHMIRWSNLF